MFALIACFSQAVFNARDEAARLATVAVAKHSRTRDKQEQLTQKLAQEDARARKQHEVVRKHKEAVEAYKLATSKSIMCATAD